MKKIKIKFAVSFVLLLNTAIFVFFFEDYVYLLDDILIPLLFVYFLVDSIWVLLPSINKTVFSGKYLRKFFKSYPKYNIEKLKSLKERDNRVALLIFFIYFTGVIVIGLLYLNMDWFQLKHMYLIFLFINFSDYFCILIWCPFRVIFLKNKCCNTCRISNWDRLMKFALLLFIPNFYTITIFLMGLLVFIIWEVRFTQKPEFFYSISNETLRCGNCDLTCKIKKE